jgi:hypothetical protein
MTRPPPPSRVRENGPDASVYELLRNPGLRDWLEEDWNRAGVAVEEFLRFISVVQFTKPRFVRKEIEFGGVRLKRATRSCPCWRLPISIRKRTHTRKSLISRASRTGISLSALGFIFASAINLRALRVYAR